MFGHFGTIIARETIAIAVKTRPAGKAIVTAFSQENSSGERPVKRYACFYCCFVFDFSKHLWIIIIKLNLMNSFTFFLFLCRSRIYSVSRVHFVRKPNTYTFFMNSKYMLKHFTGCICYFSGRHAVHRLVGGDLNAQIHRPIRYKLQLNAI